MKITVESDSVDDNGNDYLRVFSLQISDDLDIYQMLEELKIILYAMTYISKTIENAFKKINDS